MWFELRRGFPLYEVEVPVGDDELDEFGARDDKNCS
jgi:hypothetical protein